MPTVNLTNFNSTPSQQEAGVFDLSDNSELRGLLTFDSIPSTDEMHDRAERIADIAQGTGADSAMISGAPYFMSAIETSLEARGIEPRYSFSERVSVDINKPDGTVEKRSVFEHRSFVDVSSVKITDSDNKVDVKPGNENKIVNLTQHDATPAQVSGGVVEPSDKAEIRSDLTFRGGATTEDIQSKAEAIADRAVESGCPKAMIGGAPYLMSALETALSARGIEPVYAFSERRVEVVNKPDGTQERKTTFEHKGFVAVEPIPPTEKVDDDKDDVTSKETDETDKADNDDVDKVADGDEEAAIEEQDGDSVDAQSDIEETDGVDEDEAGADIDRGENESIEFDDDDDDDDVSSDWAD